MELLQVLVARAIVRRAPRRLRHRLARLLCDYASPRRTGVDIVVPYLDEQLRFLANSKDFIGWNILFNGSYEDETNDVLRRFVRPAAIVVEAGANNGSETVLLAELVGDAGHVHAFEPVPAAARCLRTNIALNDHDSRVSVYPEALGAADGRVTLHLTPDEHPNRGMASKNPYPDAAKTLVVPQITLDAWAERERIARVDLIKMDIQGAELDLLRGAARTIATSRPFILTEAASTQSSTQDLYDALVGHGYDVFTADKTFANLRHRDGLRDGNWVAIPRSVQAPPEQ